MALADWRAERLKVPIDEWLSVVERDYLADYVRSGGSAVKVVSGSHSTLSRVSRNLGSIARGLGYFFAELDPARLRPDEKKPDVHRIDRFFFEATRDVDWKALTASQARDFLESRGIRVSAERSLNDLDGIAADNGRDPADLLHEYQREFATPLVREHGLSVEFRTALTALGRSQFVPESMTPTTEEVLLGWFQGRTMPGAASALKRIHIFSRVDRSNARHMLASFCRWLPRTGHTGLIAVLDFRPYEHKRRTATQRRNETMARLREAMQRQASRDELASIVSEGDSAPPVSYSQQAYLQMLQMLRRFIDEIDWFERFCLVILTSPGFYDESSDRHYFDYDALQTRIGLEIHDARHANPAAALVHLEDAS